MPLRRVPVLVLLLIFFSFFLFLPLYVVLAEGLQPAYLMAVLKNPLYSQGLFNALVKAIVVTTLVLATTIPLAVMVDKYEFPGKSWVPALVLLPMILPPFVGALGFMQVFGQFGVLNALLAHLGLVEAGHGPDWLGRGRLGVVCLVEVLHLYPILYLNLATALANVDPTLHEAAEGLGASSWRRFRRITLPLIRPGLFAGGILVFIWSFTELGTPLMLGYHRVTPVQIFNGITELESNPEPYSLVVILLIVSTLLYVVSRLVLGRQSTTGLTRASIASHARPLRGWRRFVPISAFLALTGLASLPHLGVILLSVGRNWYGTMLPTSYTLQYYTSALAHDIVVPSIQNSLLYASLALILSLSAGLAVAVLTVRWKPPGYQLIDLMSMLPLAVPGIILAFGYLGMATRYDWVRATMDPVRNPTILLVIAYGMRRLPYVVRAAAAGLEQTPEELELAAANLGASGFMTLRRIVVPLIMANLIAGALFAFSFSMLEVSDSLILAHKSQYFPITRAIYELSNILGSGPYIACAFGVWAMVFLGTTILVATQLLGRRVGAMFRV